MSDAIATPPLPARIVRCYYCHERFQFQGTKICPKCKDVFSMIDHRDDWIQRRLFTPAQLAERDDRIEAHARRVECDMLRLGILPKGWWTKKVPGYSGQNSERQKEKRAS